MSVVAVVVIMAVVVLGVRVYQVNRQTPIWRQVAADLGLASGPTGSLTKKLGVFGRIDGIGVSIKELSGDDDTDVLFEAEYPVPRGLGLLVRADLDRRRRDSTFGRLFRRAPIPLADDHLDATLWVSGDDPQQVAAYLTPSRQHAIASLVRRLPAATVRDDKITMAISGRVDRVDDIAGKMRAMHEVALLMHRATDELDAALHRIDQGDLAEGLAALRATKPPLRRPALRMAAEIMVSGAGTTDDVAEVLDEMELEAIDDHEVTWLREWVLAAAARQAEAPDDHRVIGDPRLAGGAAPDDHRAIGDPRLAGAAAPDDHRVIGDPRLAGAEAPDPDDRVAERPPAPSPVADTPAGGPPPRPSDVSDATRQAEDLAALFEGDAASGREWFERHLLGGTVTWVGTVRRARSFGNDLDLGAGPGLKVVVRVGEVDLGDYGDGEVDAVVAFPPHTVVSDGAEIRFCAIPVRLDGFTRNIFCTAGVILD